MEKEIATALHELGMEKYAIFIQIRGKYLTAGRISGRIKKTANGYVCFGQTFPDVQSAVKLFCQFSASGQYVGEVAQALAGKYQSARWFNLRDVGSLVEISAGPRLILPREEVAAYLAHLDENSN
jgi:hypothetical protein